MKALFFLVVSSASFGAVASDAPFCVVNAGGTTCAYWFADVCQQTARSTNGACVVNQAAASQPKRTGYSPADASRSIMEAGELGRQQGEARRAARLQQEAQKAEQLRVQESHRLDQIAKLKSLLDTGAITQAEFDAEKAKLLAQP